jgi:pimeloyl-ACP methyl ester carboxylesterase
VESAVPSLLLAGAFDASTPVELAKEAAKTLSTNHLFVFPANAHVQLFRSKCAQEVLRDFLINPQVRPDPACLQSLRQPAFLALGGG